MSLGTVAGILVWMASNPTGACKAIWDNKRTPVAALRHVAAVAKALHQFCPGSAHALGAQPVFVGLPEKP